MHKSRFVTGATLLVLITLGLQSFGQDRGIKIVVFPAAESERALQYQLLPKFLDQTPGNAVDGYKRAFEKMPSDYKGDISEELSRLLRLPLDELMVNEAEALIQPFRGAIQEAKRAAWCYQCEWGHLVRQPESVLPPLKDYPFYWLNKPIRLETKLQIKEGKYDSALENMQFRFAMARHITYFNDTSSNMGAEMVANSIIRDIEQFIQAPNAPNLYWALSNLPEPFISIKPAMDRERELIFVVQPQLREINTKILSTEKADELLEYLTSRELFWPEQFWPENDDYDLTETKELLYRPAKRALLDQGYLLSKIEGLPESQVILIYHLQDYYRYADQVYKWFGLPFWQADEGLQQVMTAWGITESLEYSLFTYPKYDPETFDTISAYMIKMAVGAWEAASKKLVFLDQKIAALRCIEAIRMYAAEHEGQLPDNLEDITRVPIPINPVTGQEFIYNKQKDKAILVLSEEPVYPYVQLYYEISIR